MKKGQKVQITGSKDGFVIQTKHTLQVNQNMFQMVEEYLGKQIQARNPSQGRNTKQAQC